MLPTGRYLGVQPRWQQEQRRVLFSQLLSPFKLVQTNRVPVKPALCWLRVAEHSSEQLCVEETERATSEHHVPFLRSGLLLPHPRLESKGRARICGREGGELGSRMLLPPPAGRTQRGSKNPFQAQGE